MTVVSQGMAHKAQLAVSRALAVEPGIRVSRRFVRLVGASLAFETAAAVVIITAVFAYKALVTCPGLDECAVHAEVFAREPVLFVGDFEHMVEQFNDRVMRYQAFAVLGEHCGGTQTASSMASPMNQRNSKLYWVCSMS